jgi:hypothetical protein
VSPRRNISADIQQEVRRRAKALCEYCHTAEQWQYVPFTIDHVIPIHQGGTDTVDNLALACFHCNRRKSNKLTAEDPTSGEIVPMFNPREQSWHDHFIWSEDGLYLIGLTEVSRATIELLTLNRQRIIHIRAADILVERHPPADDPVQSSTN